MKVAICDDNPIFAEEINSLLFENSPSLFDTYTYCHPLKLLEQLKTVNFDFFILDIEMTEMNGVELAKKIRATGILSPIIFLTNHKEYMEEVFQVQTFDYLLKPIDINKLTQVLNRLTLYIKKSEKRFIFSINKITHQIPLKEIVYFEKNKRQVIIHTTTKNYTPYLSTADIQKQLGADFVQIHSSIIINSSFIKELGTNFLIIMLNHKMIELPISRRFKLTAHEKIIMSIRGGI